MSNFKVVVSNDQEFVKNIREEIKKNSGYCPCSLIKNDDTKCMCTEFRNFLEDEEKFGKCHCGLYEKIKC